MICLPPIVSHFLILLYNSNGFHPYYVANAVVVSGIDSNFFCTICEMLLNSSICSFFARHSNFLADPSFPAGFQCLIELSQFYSTNYELLVIKLHGPEFW